MATIKDIKELLVPIDEKIYIISEKIENLQTTLTSLDEIKAKYNNLEKKMEEKNQRIEFLESKLKENNIIIFGVEEKKNEILQRIVLEILKIKDLR